MKGIYNLLFERYECFLLVLIRISGIFMISPFFSSQNMPNVLKIGFSFVLSILLTLSFEFSIESTGIVFIVLIFKEFMVGLIIGYISYVFFSSFYIMGQIIDMKIGFGMVNVIDPQHRIQVPVMGNFYYILAFIFLLATNGHHAIIKALIDSYKYIPIGRFDFNSDSGFLLIDVLSRSFITGFKLSVPVVAIILLTDLLLGILAKTIPQMNVFVVGLSLKILIGLVLIFLSLPMFYAMINGVYDGAIEEIYYFFNSFIRG